MQWILRFRVCVIICLAVVLISAAVIFSALRAVLPYATGYKLEIQQEVSQQIGMPVEIDQLDAAINWFSPRLKLVGVVVYDDKDKVPLFNFREAFVELDVIASILRMEIIVADIGLVGADISIEKLSDEDWLIQGIEVSSSGESDLPEQFLYILQNADFLLHDSNIYYQDHTGDKLNLSLLDVNVDIKNSFGNHSIKFSMNLPADYGRDFAVVAELQGDIDSFDGDIYVEAHEVKTRQWNKKFKITDDYQVDSIVDLDAWLTIEDNKIVSLTTKFEAGPIRLKNVKTTKSWKSDYLAADIRFLTDGEHWNLAVSDFYFGKPSAPAWGQTSTIIASDDSDYYYVSADLIRVTDAVKIVEVVFDNKQLQSLEEFKRYQLSADIYNLNLKLPKELNEQTGYEKAYLDATVMDLSMQDDENQLNVTGLDFSVNYDDGEADITLNSRDASFTSYDIFREAIFLDLLQGELSLTVDQVGSGVGSWHLFSDQIHMKNAHIDTYSRLDILSTGSEKLLLDVQTDFSDAYGKFATHYLPTGIMDSALVDWLDMAITDGYVPSGSFILKGNPDDFPFDKNDGVFQVLFSVRDISMQFLEGWPMLTDTSATVKFNNQSLFVTEARGKTQETSLTDGYAEILNLDDPHLTVSTLAKGRNEDLQSYVWNSALDDILGDSLRLFHIEGNNELRLKLDVPLNREEVDVVIDGHLKLTDTELFYPALGYELSGINGTIDFTEDSVFADTVDARMQDRVVSLNAFTREGKSGKEVVFHIGGVITADYLLQQYQWIPGDWISGQSLWAIDIEVPNVPKDYLVHIKANSYLEDVRIDVSDQVQKDQKGRIRFSSEIDVLEDDGLQVVSVLGESDKKIIDLFATRDQDNIWNFNIDSKFMTGRGSFSAGLEKDSEVNLALENVDLHALFVRENNKDSKPLQPSDFPPLNWSVKKLLWDDWTFTDVKVITDWHKHGMLINKFSLHGPEMFFDARGTWLTSWRNTHETVLQGTISSTNLGATLAGLGFERSIDRCDYSATFDTKWPAQPYQISWANMIGKTTFEMNDGEILEADPGTGGRLLGLLNIFKLTNRLAFDFDDVTREGFSFDNIKGEFDFVDGDGSLKNFDVSAPAADINMFGSIGMVKRDYGLLMRVKPNTDSLTFAGGTLLGGVVVGAGLALIQKVFDLGVIGHDVYSITGSWDDPKIEKIVQRHEDTDEKSDEDDDF